MVCGIGLGLTWQGVVVMRELLKKRQADGWTKQELAEYYEIKSFDGALPQGWLDELASDICEYAHMDRNDAYDMVRCGTVWVYDDDLFGHPFFFYKELDVVANVCIRRRRDKNVQGEG